MGKELKAWALAESILGKELTDKLRNGNPIQISASNGEIYEINPNRERLLNLTRRESYCVHPSDSDDYPFGDMVVLWWTFLHHSPEKLEETVGDQDEGHRSPYGTRIHRNFYDNVVESANDPLEMFNQLSNHAQGFVTSLIGELSTLYSNGDIIFGGN